MKVTVENKKGLNKNIKVFVDKKTISSYMEEKYDEVKNEHMFDQEIINGILQNNQTGVTYGVYPLEFVSNGHIYFSESIQTGNEYVVHANFTIGKDNKINKLKGANLWVSD